MTPLQKIVRLQDIERELQAEGISHDRAQELHADRTLILAGSHRPPAELFTRVEPDAWADAFAERFASVSAEAVIPWFGGAMSTAYNAAREVGRAEGAQSGAQAVQKLIEVAQLVLLLHDSKRHKLSLVRDNANPEAPPENVSEQLRRALLALGIEPLTPQ
jgi:hypothetical protein